MTDHPVTTDTTIRILKHALANKPVRSIAGVLDMPVADVEDILKSNGHPDAKAMRHHLARLQPEPRPTALPTGGTGLRPTPATVTALPSPPRVTAVLPPAATRVNIVRPDQMSGTTLIAEGKKSKTRTVQRAAAKAEKAHATYVAALKALETVLTTDKDQSEIRETIADLKAKLAAEKAKLTAERAKLSGVAAPTRKTPERRTPRGYSYTAVREWARDNGVDVNPKGTPAKAAIEAYKAAQQHTELLEQAWPTPRAGEEG